MLVAMLLGLLTTIANIVGAYLAVLQKNPSKRLLTNFIGFGGGFLIGAALLEMAPEAISHGAYMPAFIALGYLLVYLGEHLFGVHLHHMPENGEMHEHGHAREHERAGVRIAGGAEAGHAHGAAERRQVGAPWLARANMGPAALISAAGGAAMLVAFNIHDFMDGLGMGAAMAENGRLGSLVFMAVLVHEIPAGFTIAAVALGSGATRRGGILAGVSIGIVTLFAIPIPFLIGSLHPAVTGAFVALATGTFLYVGASLLVPVVETGGFRWSFLWVVVGFVTFYATAQLTDRFLGAG